MFVYESANVKFQNQYKDSILDKTVGKVEKIFSFRLKIFVERFNKGFFVSLYINKMNFIDLENKQKLIPIKYIVPKYILSDYAPRSSFKIQSLNPCEKII